MTSCSNVRVTDSTVNGLVQLSAMASPSVSAQCSPSKNSTACASVRNARSKSSVKLRVRSTLLAARHMGDRLPDRFARSRSVHPAHYPRIAPIVRQFAEERGLPDVSSTWPHALVGYLNRVGV